MFKKYKYRTDYLFNNSSLLSGAGTVINLAGNYYDYNYSNSDCEADNKAIRNDFGVIGEDIKEAMRKISIDNNVLTSK